MRISFILSGSPGRMRRVRAGGRSSSSIRRARNSSSLCRALPASLKSTLRRPHRENFSLVILCLLPETLLLFFVGRDVLVSGPAVEQERGQCVAGDELGFGQDNRP